MTDFTIASASSPQAGEVAALFAWVLGLSGVIFLGIWVATAYCGRRFRVHEEHRENTPDPPQIYGGLKLEILWTVIPAVIVGILAYMSITGMRSILPPAGDRTPDVIVTGHQWWWEVRYPGYGVVTANEFVIPVGKESLIGLESADVIHSFWVPRLAPKQDMIPGVSRHIWIEPNKSGTYQGTCAEFCGNQHAWMRLKIRAVPEAEFKEWIARMQKKPAAEPAIASHPGAGIFASLACAKCHTISGTGADGTAAPDLSHLGSRKMLASGVVPNTPENLANWLREPDSIKPGSHMPDFNLSEQQISALVDYLGRLK